MTEINCAEACINGCVLGEECPHLEERQKASEFIHETSLDKMLEIAQARLDRLRSQHSASQ
ncbi:MAG: hypothetical protein AB4040_12390 [Synechococcus sp.]